MLRLVLALWRLVLPFLLFLLGWGVVVDRALARFGLSQPVLDTPAKTTAYGWFLAAIFGVGAVLSYNLAALVYRLTRGAPRNTVHPPAMRRSGGGTAGLLAPYQRIGLILAGGGAKGAYQAGAMRAIWEFLEEHDAIDRVRMVAGTSIGSWNAMFWLAGLVRPPATGGPSAHEAWWSAIRPERILDFDWFVPMMQNHIARSTPWRTAFQQIFRDTPAIHDRLATMLSSRHAPTPAPLNFYLTRSNVEAAVLEFTTNSWGMAELERIDPQTGARVPVFDTSLYHVLDGADPPGAFQELEDAVFASMDIPPVFPLTRMKAPGFGTEWFEDGGVIENLPMLFGTQVEHCDLLFVLPLNATFRAPVNHRSIIARLSRVMEARQGVIERNAFKLAYLYNELHQATGKSLVSIFAICPAGRLAVGTVDFHKRREAGAAYRLMYDATAQELKEGFGNLTPQWIRLATVGANGERRRVDEF